MQLQMSWLEDLWPLTETQQSFLAEIRRDLSQPSDTNTQFGQTKLTRIKALVEDYSDFCAADVDVPSWLMICTPYCNELAAFLEKFLASSLPEVDDLHQYLQAYCQNNPLRTKIADLLYQSFINKYGQGSVSDPTGWHFDFLSYLVEAGCVAASIEAVNRIQLIADRDVANALLTRFVTIPTSVADFSGACARLDSRALH